ncbi:MAG: hypothetical protein ACD_16C00118G0005 [uncultured bacterium]|nr:MAG: hypothetical protein ACD_16C00118G0005 [uncultured bacterium]OFW67854.1 MAG: hypothetical protein A2X70_00325 [Alphaproteobacteria bacterium GWC2_42_16]OFW74770.1 MAG: hypothetical protein A2Z80_03975 [Alphaproteobacteria bacterium GWA2_41_27]OFW85009.1 MAG: hypothetical protein A3E50_02385 [Alphaproteobacteria bacterium RIFCSPHIGHO2_12_FULL_42_100]OFW86689.1 MAG: hypothetical protein A2W06_01600 [Alphaproteobacteria bacterium RBG_16_42_14]OFW92299.1 MAG: hypothetical protein A2W46_008
MNIKYIFQVIFCLTLFSIGGFVANNEAFGMEEPPVSITPLRQNFTINFLWINENDDNKKANSSIFPKEKAVDCLRGMIGFRLANPEAEMVLWYDETLTSQQAVDNSRKIVNRSGITMRNIRDIDLVKSHAVAFDSARPLYFRVDLARAVVAYHVLKEERDTRDFVCSDFDITPIDCGLLVEKHDKELSEFGMLLLKGKYTHDTGYILQYENSFQVLRRSDQLLQSLYDGLIYPALSLGCSVSIQQELTTDTMDEFVYEHYSDVFLLSYGNKKVLEPVLFDIVKRTKNKLDFNRPHYGLGKKLYTLLQNPNNRFCHLAQLNIKNLDWPYIRVGPGDDGIRIYWPLVDLNYPRSRYCSSSKE